MNEKFVNAIIEPIDLRDIDENNTFNFEVVVARYHYHGLGFSSYDLESDVNSFIDSFKEAIVDEFKNMNLKEEDIQDKEYEVCIKFDIDNTADYYGEVSGEIEYLEIAMKELERKDEYHTFIKTQIH